MSLATGAAGVQLGPRDVACCRRTPKSESPVRPTKFQRLAPSPGTQSAPLTGGSRSNRAKHALPLTEYFPFPELTRIAARSRRKPSRQKNQGGWLPFRMLNTGERCLQRKQKEAAKALREFRSSFGVINPDISRGWMGRWCNVVSHPRRPSPCASYYPYG